MKSLGMLSVKHGISKKQDTQLFIILHEQQHISTESTWKTGKLHFLLAVATDRRRRNFAY